MLIKKNKKLPLLPIIITAALVIVGVGAWTYFQFFNKPAEKFENTAGISKVNYDPPTEEEKQAGNEQKQEVIEQDKRDNQASTPNTQAEVIISDASYYNDSSSVEIRAYIANIIEDSGQCTVILTQGSSTVRESSNAFRDAKTTQCGAINIPRSKFPTGGTWNLTVSYTSSTAKGSKTASVRL